MPAGGGHPAPGMPAMSPPMMQQPSPGSPSGQQAGQPVFPAVLLGVGMRVSIHGLKAGHINGSLGKVKTPRTANGRVEVQLDGLEAEVKAFKRENVFAMPDKWSVSVEDIPTTATSIVDITSAGACEPLYSKGAKSGVIEFTSYDDAISLVELPEHLIEGQAVRVFFTRAMAPFTVEQEAAIKARAADERRAGAGKEFFIGGLDIGGPHESLNGLKAKLLSTLANGRKWVKVQEGSVARTLAVDAETLMAVPETLGADAEPAAGEQPPSPTAMQVPEGGRLQMPSSEEELEKLSTPELKVLLHQHGRLTPDLIEKEDLRNQLRVCMMGC